MTRIAVDREFADRAAIRLLTEVLDLFDTTRLGEFKVRKSGANGGRYIGLHGNCKYPDPFSPEGSKKKQYRISCSFNGTDDDFPKPGFVRHAGTVRAEYVASSADEALAWVCGHELFHFLGERCSEWWESGTGQVRGMTSSEREADKMGYEFLYAIREGRSAVELAAAMIGDEPRVAEHRYPYRRS